MGIEMAEVRLHSLNILQTFSQIFRENCVFFVCCFCMFLAFNFLLVFFFIDISTFPINYSTHVCQSVDFVLLDFSDLLPFVHS